MKTSIEKHYFNRDTVPASKHLSFSFCTESFSKKCKKKTFLLKKRGEGGRKFIREIPARYKLFLTISVIEYNNFCQVRITNFFLSFIKSKVIKISEEKVFFFFTPPFFFYLNIRFFYRWEFFPGNFFYCT